MFLSQEDICELEWLREVAASDCPLSQLKDNCQRLPLSLRDRSFPFVYVAILRGCQGRLDDCCTLLDLAKENTFAGMLREYLLQRKAFVPSQDSAFEQVDPYHVFVETDFYRAHKKATLETFREFAVRYPPSSDHPTVLDIGTGNGVLIADILNEIDRNFRGINLLLLDSSEAMLGTAKRYCEEHVKLPIKIKTIGCKVQGMTPEQRNEIRQQGPIWFINASFSLHHMPWEVKIPILENLKSFSPHCFIAEFNWNNDRPEKDSPEFVYSVMDTYRWALGEILNCPATEEAKRNCIFNFSLVEAITMLKNERMSRGDFHAPIEEWQEIGQKAGFQVIGTQITSMTGNRPATFVMELNCNRERQGRHE